MLLWLSPTTKYGDIELLIHVEFAFAPPKLYSPFVKK